MDSMSGADRVICWVGLTRFLQTALWVTAIIGHDGEFEPARRQIEDARFDRRR